MHELEQEKTQLQQKVNEALIKLKRFNEKKSEMSHKLAEQMQFVRDLQKATGLAGLEDLNTIASSELQDEYKKEKALHKQLEQQLTTAEQERTHILDRMHLFNGDQEVVVIQQNGQRKTFKVTQINIARLLNEISELKQQIELDEQQRKRLQDALIKSEDELAKQEQLCFQLQHERENLIDRAS